MYTQISVGQFVLPGPPSVNLLEFYELHAWLHAQLDDQTKPRYHNAITSLSTMVYVHNACRTPTDEPNRGPKGKVPVPGGAVVVYM